MKALKILIGFIVVAIIASLLFLIINKKIFKPKTQYNPTQTKEAVVADKPEQKKVIEPKIKKNSAQKLKKKINKKHNKEFIEVAISSYYKQGVKNIISKQYKEGIINFNSALELDPNFANAFMDEVMQNALIFPKQ